MSDVFISYKAEDRRRIQPLVQALQADGYSVWWDEHIGTGDEWRHTIEHQLDAARCVLVIWSKRSVGPDGHFVRDEASRAQRRHVYVPVLIDAVDPPLGFGESQATSLRGWHGDRSDPRYRAVLAAVQRIAGPCSEEAAQQVFQPKRVSRRSVLVGSGAVAAAAVAGVGAWALLKPDSAASGSIAVLPFANLSGDPAQAYFSDGIAEELRSALSRLAGLKVVARTSSEMVRDSDVKTAARKLGVEHIVSGSVRRSPSMIRVSAQLIDGDDGLERWSQTFDRPPGDLLEIQTSIAQNVAQALSVELGEDRDILTLGGTSNPAAQDLYLRSNPGLVDTREALDSSLGLLNSAIALDPDFAMAHARKAFIFVLLGGIYALSREESERYYRESLASVQRALAIEPRLASAYATRGALQRERLNIGGAVADLERADSLPGDDAHALRIYAMMLAQSRRFPDAHQKIEQAKSLDPLNPVSLEVEALILAWERKYPEAVAAARRSLQLGPDRVQPRRILANSLLQSGKTAEAAAEYGKLEPNDYRRLLGEAVLAARAGDRAQAMAKLQTMERRYGNAALYQYAEIYAQLGMRDEAISALRRALQTRDPGMASIQVDWFVDPLRRDPRFVAIVNQMNFPA